MTATTANSLRAGVSRALGYAQFEAIGLLRNGEQLLVAIVLPAAALLGLGVLTVVELPLADYARIDVVTPGVLGLAVVSSSFTSQAIATAFDRRWGVLRQLATTPLGPRGIVAGKVLATFAVQAVQVLVLSALAVALGWHPQAAGIGWALLAWILGSVCFTALGLLLAARLRAEAVLALANLLWLVLASVGGVLLPTSEDSGVSVGAAAWLPSGAFGDALRSSLLTGAPTPWSLVVLAGWTAVSLAAAARWFRPSE